jgi:hypothetical protein
VPSEISRLTRRLGARDRLFLAVVACAGVVAIPVGIVLADNNSSANPGAPTHCVNELKASIMGGANYQYCGKAADEECAANAANSESLAAQCRKLSQG